MVLQFADSLVPTVRKALCDREPEVRLAAARTFDSLHTNVGGKALDDILPVMLEQLSDPELHDYTLDGLRQVLTSYFIFNNYFIIGLFRHTLILESKIYSWDEMIIKYQIQTHNI